MHVRPFVCAATVALPMLLWRNEHTSPHGSELLMMLKTCIQGLSRVTRGLGKPLGKLAKPSHLNALLSDTIAASDDDGSGEVSKEEFLRWAEVRWRRVGGPWQMFAAVTPHRRSPVGAENDGNRGYHSAVCGGGGGDFCGGASSSLVASS